MHHSPSHYSLQCVRKAKSSTTVKSPVGENTQQGRQFFNGLHGTPTKAKNINILMLRHKKPTLFSIASLLRQVY